MKFLVMLVLVFGMIGCTKKEVKGKVCDTAKTAAAIVAAQTAVELGCKNVDAIKADLEKKLVDGKVCEPVPETGLLSAKSAVGTLVCPPVIDGLFAGALTQIPASWECTGGPLVSDIRTKLIDACTKAL